MRLPWGIETSAAFRAHAPGKETTGADADYHYSESLLLISASRTAIVIGQPE